MAREALVARHAVVADREAGEHEGGVLDDPLQHGAVVLDAPADPGPKRELMDADLAGHVLDSFLARAVALGIVGGGFVGTLRRSRRF